jgi:hypothetical protein
MKPAYVVRDTPLFRCLHEPCGVPSSPYVCSLSLAWNGPYTLDITHRIESRLGFEKPQISLRSSGGTHCKRLSLPCSETGQVARGLA